MKYKRNIKKKRRSVIRQVERTERTALENCQHSNVYKWNRNTTEYRMKTKGQDAEENAAATLTTLGVTDIQVSKLWW